MYSKAFQDSGVSSIESFTENNLGLNNLWEFGCSSVVFLPSKKRTKRTFGPGGEEGINVGYSTGCAYTVYIIATGI